MLHKQKDDSSDFAMAVPHYEVRALRKDEIPQALALWKGVGYPEGNHCIDTWFEIDDQGFWVAVTDQGEIIGLCCAVANKKDLFHVGLYSVKKQYRGQGIGMAVWKACLNHIGDSNAVVNAVPGKLELYSGAGGFPIVEEGWYSYYCQSDDIRPEFLLMDYPGVDIVPIDDQNINLVLEYDFKLLGYEREKAVRLTVKEPESTSYLALEDGTCVGYGVYKVTCLGFGMVGPLYADSQDIAEVLLKRMIMSLPQAKGFCMMIIDANPCAKTILDKLEKGMYMMESPRLYRKEKVSVDLSKVFGQFNLNFCPY